MHARLQSPSKAREMPGARPRMAPGAGVPLRPIRPHAAPNYHPPRSARVAAPVVQGFWTELGIGAGIAALGYGVWRGIQSYRSHRDLAQRDRAARARVERERRDGGTRAERERAQAVTHVLAETDAAALTPGLRVDRDRGSRSEAGRRGAGYRINLNPEHPISPEATAQVGHDPNLHLTARVHELTHIATYLGYGGRNAAQPDPDNIAALPATPEAIAERGRLVAQHAELDRIFDRDPVIARLPQGQQDFIRGRLDYLGGYAHNEFDTVVNELIYYFLLSGISASSPLSKELVRLAGQRRRARNP